MEIIELETKLVDLINKQKISQNQITIADLEKDFKELGIDSIKFITLIVEIEKLFGFEYPDDYLQVKKIGNLRNMVKLIDNLI